MNGGGHVCLVMSSVDHLDGTPCAQSILHARETGDTSFLFILTSFLSYSPGLCSYTGIFTSLEFLSEESDSADSMDAGGSSGSEDLGGILSPQLISGRDNFAIESASSGSRASRSCRSRRGGSSSRAGRGRAVEDLLELEAPALLELAGAAALGSPASGRSNSSSNGGSSGGSASAESRSRLLVGFTATPYRLDKKKLLGDVFQVGHVLFTSFLK